MISRPRASLLRAGFAVCVGLVAVYLVISAFDPFRTNWGDPWSDGNALTSGRYFAEDGFVATRFTPVLDVGPLQPDSLRYIHYPPLPDLWSGLVQSIIGTDSLPLQRILAILFSACALALMFLYVRRFFGEPVAYVAILVVATNLLFIQYADTIHHIPLYWMTGMAALVAGTRWLDGGGTRTLVLAGAATFFCFLASYDFFFFLPIMTLASVRLADQQWLRGRGRALVLSVAAGGALSIIVKNALAAWAVGVSAWWKDILFQFVERATHEQSSVRGYKEALVQVVFWRCWRFLTPLFVIAVLAQLLAVADRIRKREPLVDWKPTIFLLAAFPFLFVFTQLVVEQYHPMVLLLPFAAVSIAVVLVAVWRRFAWLAGLLLVGYLAWQLWQFRLFRKAFLEKDDIAAVQKHLESDRHQFIVTNIFPDGPVRFYWNRHMFGIETDQDPSKSRPRFLAQLRNLFDEFGDDTPITIVQLDRMAPHMYDKGLFAYFGRERRWPWIARPDFYRNSWPARFNAMDREFDAVMVDVGHVVHESKQMHVRQVTRADLDRDQLAKLPAVAPKVYDFASAASEAVKWSGFTERVDTDKTGAGGADMYERIPARLVFTLQGIKNVPTGPAIRTSSLRLRLPPAATRLTFELSTQQLVQHVTIRLNDHVIIANAALAVSFGVKSFSAEVPADWLQADGVQRISFEYGPSIASRKPAARLHRIIRGTDECALP